MSYSIRQVIELTGASEFLLRSWENRYKAFKPKRTNTGRRIYSDKDILKARALLQLTERGARVGSVAHLPLKVLQKLLDEEHQFISSSEDANPKIHIIFSKVQYHQWNEIRAILLSERKRLGGLNWIHNLITPLLNTMASMSDSGRLSIAEERLLSATIEECLQQPPASRHKSKLKIAFATIEGDFHDLGLKIAAFIAREVKVDVLYLGTHIPMRELSEVCIKAKVTHVLLTSTPSSSIHKNDFFKYVHFLDKNLPAKIRLWLAGRNALANKLSLGRHFLYLNSFQQFQQELISGGNS